MTRVLVLVDVEVDRDTGPGAVRLGVNVTVFARRAAALVGVEHNHREPEWHFYFATLTAPPSRALVQSHMILRRSRTAMTQAELQVEDTRRQVMVSVVC